MLPLSYENFDDFICQKDLHNLSVKFGSQIIKIDGNSGKIDVSCNWYYPTCSRVVVTCAFHRCEDLGSIPDIGVKTLLN